MRRVIRIKAMQALYSFYQNKAVNLEEVKRRIADGLIDVPDFYNSGTEEKAGFRALLPVLLDEAFAGQNATQDLPESQKWLASLAMQAVADWENENQRQKKRISETLKSDVTRQSEKEVFFWTIFKELFDRAIQDHNKQQNSAGKTMPSDLADKDTEAHPFLPLLDSAIKDGPAPYRGTDPDWIIRLYPVIFKDLPEYQAYLAENQKEKGTYEQIWKVLYRKLLRSNVFNEIMEEHDLHWSENRILLEVSLKEHFQQMCEGTSPVFSPDKEDQEEMTSFFNSLFESCLQHQEEDESLLESIISNWDPERVAPTDKYLILLSINEMRNFPHIPVKVTINEYLEIAKAYSSPGSVSFINGVTDRMAKVLQKAGKLKKSARGMMDNK